MFRSESILLLRLWMSRRITVLLSNLVFLEAFRGSVVLFSCAFSLIPRVLLNLFLVLVLSIVLLSLHMIGMEHLKM